MAVQLHELTMWLSGGAGNTLPLSSLGGVISSTAKVISQNASATTNVTGVTMVDATGNTEGNGTITFTLTGTTLQWTPPGGSIGTAVDVSVDGRYSIAGAGGELIIVDVISANLPVGNQTDADIAITNNKNAVFDDIIKSESFAGDNEYRALYVKNESTVDTAFDVLLWIQAQPVGADTLQIMIDPAGAGDGVTTGVAQTVVDENTAPSTGTFSTPSSEATAISLGQLTSGQVAAFWIKRTIPALNTVTTLNDLSALGIKAFV